MWLLLCVSVSLPEISFSPFQYNQWICITTEGGAQDVPAEGAIALAQGEVTERLPPTAGILRGAVSGKRSQSNRACKYQSLALRILMTRFVKRQYWLFKNKNQEEKTHRIWPQVTRCPLLCNLDWEPPEHFLHLATGAQNLISHYVAVYYKMVPTSHWAPLHVLLVAVELPAPNLPSQEKSSEKCYLHCQSVGQRWAGI